MDCAAYRRAILAEPHADRAELRAHRAACHDCTQYTLRLRRFESRLERALCVDTERMQARAAAPSEAAPPPRAAQPEATAAPRRGPPEGVTPAPRAVLPLPAEPRRSKPARRYRVWSAAAAALLAVGIAGVVWLAVPGPSLAADVVGGIDPSFPQKFLVIMLIVVTIGG